MHWLLLLHQIPPKPPYLRAKILKRLNQLGALAIKNSAYLLPASEERIEDLHWLRGEIEGQEGEAWILRVEAIAGLSDETILEQFRVLRSADYAALVESGKRLLAYARLPMDAGQEKEWRALIQRYEQIRRIDYSARPGNEEWEVLVKTVERIRQSGAREAAPKPALSQAKAGVWVTRRGVKVDRIASAWLIRHFFDSEAKFRFVAPETYTHAPGEIRFDMYEGEFTHEGDLCTFEVLLDWMGVADAGLRAVAEVVHDVDMKDAKYARVEAAGIAVLIDGIGLRHASDEARLEEGTALFESLYARLKHEAA